MADMIDTLKRLQELDGELYHLRRLEDEKPQELEAAEQRLVTQESRVKAIEQRLQALQVTQKEKENELGTREESVKKLQGQLFQLKTNKEYTIMQHEIDTLKTDNSILEETILRALEEIDGAGATRKEEEGRLAQERKALKVASERIQRELEEIVEKIGQLERNRKTITPELPADALSAYERVLEMRDGLALVPVANESCGGCNRQLPPQIVNEVLLRARMVTCESCNRILVTA